MAQMASAIGKLGTARALSLFGNWTDRIASGELPFAQPSRPAAVERNIVITLWDWATPTSYLHDEISTDKRNPTLNAKGLIYGAPEESSDFVPILDPTRNAADQIRMPVRDPNTSSSKHNLRGPSPYWGDVPVWDSQTRSLSE
jgi:hypothetical protein